MHFLAGFLPPLWRRWYTRYLKRKRFLFIEDMTEDFDMIWVNSPKSQCDLPATLFQGLLDPKANTGIARFYKC